jgi:membrane protease YdiL (CAAX protease family)
MTSLTINQEDIPAAALKTKPLLYTILLTLWGLVLVLGVVFANNTIYQSLSGQPLNTYVNDLVSDGVLLFVALMPVFWLPRFFGYQLGSTLKHWKILLGMAVFFIAAPLIYRLVVGETPFGANTWFFEGVVVPVAEEGFFRGILVSMLAFGLGKLYQPRTAGLLTILLSTLLFACAHLNNLGDYPTGFILFQVGFSTIVGLAFGYARVKTGSLYPAIILHALFNIAGTL